MERQNDWFREIYEKCTGNLSPELHAVDWAIAEVCNAKNHLRRSHGYPPSQRVCGTTPRTGDGIIDEDHGLRQRQEFISPDDEWKRRQEVRFKAREAFMESQAKSSLSRAHLGRPRVQQGDFTPGQYVYIYRTRKVAGGVARQRQNIGEWIGPGVIVGKECSELLGITRWTMPTMCKRALTFGRVRRVGTDPPGKGAKDDLALLLQNMEVDDDYATEELHPEDRLHPGHLGHSHEGGRDDHHGDEPPEDDPHAQGSGEASGSSKRRTDEVPVRRMKHKVQGSF